MLKITDKTTPPSRETESVLIPDNTTFKGMVSSTKGTFVKAAGSIFSLSHPGSYWNYNVDIFDYQEVDVELIVTHKK